MKQLSVPDRFSIPNSLPILDVFDNGINGSYFSFAGKSPVALLLVIYGV
jgi:hypothetical protein